MELAGLEDDVTVVAAVAVLVGLVGTVLPVLPGGSLIAGAVLVWAIVVREPVAWIAFAGVVVLIVAGAVLKYLTAGKIMTSSTVPWWSFAVAGVLGIVGFFVIPVVGLLVGFVGGLFLAELYRLRESRSARGAWASTWLALKGVGLGVLVELGAGLLAAVVWGVAVWRSGVL